MRWKKRIRRGLYHYCCYYYFAIKYSISVWFFAWSNKSLRFKKKKKYRQRNDNKNIFNIEILLKGGSRTLYPHSPGHTRTHTQKKRNLAIQWAYLIKTGKCCSTGTIEEETAKEKWMHTKIWIVLLCIKFVCMHSRGCFACFVVDHWLVNSNPINEPDRRECYSKTNANRCVYPIHTPALRHAASYKKRKRRRRE